MAKSPYFNLADLRGGINDSDSPFALADNQVTQAFNVDFREGMIATKRKGMAPLSLFKAIFSRDLPNLQVTAKGGWTAAASGSVAVGAGTDEDGSGNNDHVLVVRITTKAATDVTAVDYGGVALTMQGEVTNGNAGRLEVWTKMNPALAGANVNITLAGAADCSVIVERWSRVDTVAGIQNFTTASGANSVSQPNNTNWSAQFMGQYALAWSSTTTADAVGAGQVNEQQQSNGNARVLGVNVIGMKPKTQFNITLGASVDLVVMWWALKGRTAVPGTTFTRITALMRHQPSNLLAEDEIWAQDNFGRLDRYLQSTGWQTGIPTANYSCVAIGDGQSATNGVSLHGKFFLALDGTLAVDILQLWDGSVLRFAGLSSPLPITVADTAPAGAYSTTRYFRIRTVEQQSGVVVRRSEPSAVFTFTPAGTKTGAVITFPAVVDFISTNGETHWEVEASVDNVLFYRISTQTLATGSYTDTTAYAGTSTYVASPLSENLLEYTRPFAARHVTVDQDRLLCAGSNFTPILDSRVQWTVLRADNGVGNDERVPQTSRFFVDLDALRGGAITYMSDGAAGAIYLFKQQQIHKLIRTGVSTKAYDTHVESYARGCLMRAGTTGCDQDGLPAVYFTDPNVGLCRFGVRGVEDLSQMRRALVQRFNKNAKYFRILFYPKHWLVWLTVCIDGGTTPTRLMCFNIRSRGWTDYTGSMATFLSAVLSPNATGELRPWIGPQTLGSVSIMGEADNGVDDDGTKYRGYLTTKPYQVGQLYQKFVVAGAALMARCGAADVNLALIRNYGLERKETESKSLVASGSETSTAVTFDDATMAECFVCQFELGDPVAFVGSQLDQQWTLDELAVKFTTAEEITGS